MALTPYCGRCHKWMDEWYPNVWVCDCTVSGQVQDTTKNPNCHNPSHDHHDPESPIVLARQAEYEEKEAAEYVPGTLEETLPGAEACGHPKNDDGSCTFWGCPTRGSLVDGTPFFDTLDELDKILEDTNRQVEEETHCDIFGHVWGKMGRVGLGDQGLSVVDWGPVKCLRCGEPEPEYGQVGSKWIPPPPPDDEPKHKCPGCNLRDLTMEDAKDHIGLLLGVIGLVGILQPGLPKQLAGKSVQDIRREAAAFLRMSENKIRAMEGENDAR